MADYIEKRENGYYVVGSRISLDSIIHLFRDGASPESIVKSFPSLSLEQAYGAITYYLARRAEMDAYLADAEGLWEEARRNQDSRSAELQEKLAQSQHAILGKHS